jgi:hypothetical protein
MAKNIIFILLREELPLVKKLTNQLEDYEVFIFDPTIVDEAISEGIGNINFQAVQNHSSRKVQDEWAWNKAIEFGRKINAINSLEIDISTWQHLNFYYLITRLRWFKDQWIDVLPRFKNNTIHFFLNLATQELYFPSFIPGISLLQAINKLNISKECYPYELNVPNIDLIPDLGEYPNKKFDLLIHAPTLVHDKDYINSELSKVTKTTICLPSRLWDIHINTNERLHLRLIPQEELDSITQFNLSEMKMLLEELIGEYITSGIFKNKQIDAILSSYKRQFILFKDLNEYILNPPSKIFITDHDTGFHGPILSFAKKNNIEVLRFPHSKFSYDLLEPNIKSLTFVHPIQSKKDFDLKGEVLHTEKISFGLSFMSKATKSDELSTVGILLNATTLSGNYHTYFTQYLEGLKELINSLKSINITPLIRSRPGNTIKHFINQINTDISFHEGLFDHFYENVDLVIMYGEPTSGLINILNSECPLVYVHDQDLSENVYTKLRNEILMPKLTIVEATSLIEKLKVYPEEFKNYKCWVLKAYKDLFFNVRELNDFL